MPAIEYKDDRNELLVISSVTGKPLDAFEPIPLGQNFYSYAFASDERTLALVSNGKLYLIDLPSWQYRASDVDLHGWLSSVVYSPDETLLALASGEPDGGLRIVDAKSGEIKASAQIGFSIRNVRFTNDGNAIMVYGPHLAGTGVAANAGISVGVPKTALFDVSDLSLLWSVDLKGIRDGTFPKNADEPITQDIYQPGAATHYQPGITFDPTSDVLYAVHGDEDKLTTIDFARRKVSTVDIHIQTSWLDQFMAMTAGVAYAKGMDGTSKQAVISPDGKFLYVVGSTETFVQKSDGNMEFKQTFLGLQIVAIEDGALINNIDSEGNSVQLSSDHRQVFLTGWKNNGSYGSPWTDIYDTSSNSLVRHIDNAYLTSTRLIGGRPILVSSYGVSDNLCYMASFNPADWSMVNEWHGKNCYGWLVAP